MNLPSVLANTPERPVHADIRDGSQPTFETARIKLLWGSILFLVEVYTSLIELYTLAWRNRISVREDERLNSSPMDGSCLATVRPHRLHQDTFHKRCLSWARARFLRTDDFFSQLSMELVVQIQVLHELRGDL